MKRLRVLLLCIALLPLTAFAQELDCDVSVDFERLPSFNKEQLTDFARDVKTYVNQFSWTGKNYGSDKIKCSVSIFFQSATGDNKYTVQAFVGSQRPIYSGERKSGKDTPILRLKDDKWTFTYIKNQSLYHNEFRADALLSVLDFYAYLIIGFDNDSFDPLGGAKEFQKAADIANLASSSISIGWEATGASYSRTRLINEVIDAKYEPLRQSFYNYHYNGLDMMSEEARSALDTMLVSLKTMSDLRASINTQSLLIKTFFETKYMEIADIFLQYPNRSVYSTLASYDPSHQQTYDQYRMK